MGEAVVLAGTERLLMQIGLVMAGVEFGSHSLATFWLPSLIKREKGDSDGWSSHTLASSPGLLPPPVFYPYLIRVYCKRSKTGGDEDLGTRLVIAGVDLAGTS